MAGASLKEQHKSYRAKFFHLRVPNFARLPAKIKQHENRNNFNVEATSRFGRPARPNMLAKAARNDNDAENVDADKLAALDLR